MISRLARAEQNGRNRARLGAGARRVFLARGYYAATLEQIVDEAGFSKGVVYSRFASKADMFLALLDDRITERAAQNADLARQLAGSGNFAAVAELAQRAERGAPGWRLLGTEFRVHAARDPGLDRRAARRLSAGPAAHAAGPGRRARALPRGPAARHRPRPVRAGRPAPAPGDDQGADDGQPRRGHHRPAAEPGPGGAPPGRVGGRAVAAAR